jgi:hypothetical protein
MTSQRCTDDACETKELPLGPDVPAFRDERGQRFERQLNDKRGGGAWMGASQIRC